MDIFVPICLLFLPHQCHKEQMLFGCWKVQDDKSYFWVFSSLTLNCVKAEWSLCRRVWASWAGLEVMVLSSRCWTCSFSLRNREAWNCNLTMLFLHGSLIFTEHIELAVSLVPWETSRNEVFRYLEHKSRFFFNEKLKDCTMKPWIQSNCSFLLCECEFLSQYETDNVFFRCKVNLFSFLSFAFEFSCSYSAASTTYGTWCCCWNRIADKEKSSKVPAGNLMCHKIHSGCNMVARHVPVPVSGVEVVWNRLGPTGLGVSVFRVHGGTGCCCPTD